MAYPTRNTSSYTLPNLSTGVLLKEDGFALLTDDGRELLIENPYQSVSLTSRNSSSYTLPSLSSSTTGSMTSRNASSYTLPLRS